MHVAIIGLVVRMGERLQLAGSEDGIPGLPGGGGGGGGSARAGAELSDITYYVQITPLSAPAPAPIETPELPEITPLEPITVDLPDPIAIDAPQIAMPTGPIGAGPGTGGGPGSGTGTGGGSGSGTGPGTGPGEGAGSGPGAGSGGTVRQPEAVGIIWPPEPPRNLRGRVIHMRLQVDARGRVTAAEVVGSSGSSRYDRELQRQAMEWQFRPARDQTGRAIAYTFEYEIEI